MKFTWIKDGEEVKECELLTLQYSEGAEKQGYVEIVDPSGILVQFYFDVVVWQADSGGNMAIEFIGITCE